MEEKDGSLDSWVLGWEVAGDWLLGLKEEGLDFWVPGSYPASGPSSTPGPWLRWPWLVPDPAAPVQPLPLPQLPALGGGQEKARGNPAGRAGRGRPVRGLGLGEEIWVGLAFPCSLILELCLSRLGPSRTSEPASRPLLPDLSSGETKN